jgi:hypothetical protein
MKKIILVLATCAMFALNSNSQWYSKYYWKTELMDHTMDEMSTLLLYAKGFKNFGNVMLVGSLAATSAGFVIFVRTLPIPVWPDSEPLSGGGLILGGGITLLTGLVVTFTAIDRMKEIKNALSLCDYNNVRLKISPTFQTNFYSMGYYSGIAIQLTF